MLTQSRTFYAFELGLFKNLDNLTCVLREPEPDPANPIICPGKRGEPDSMMTQFLATIQPARTGWDMWYCGRDENCQLNPCKAHSNDGLTWQKQGPLVGIPLTSEIVNVYMEDDVYHLPVKDIFSLRPEHAQRESVRQLIEREMDQLKTPGVPGISGIATSSDGLHFSTSPAEQPLLPVKFEVPRIYKFKGQYFMTGQTNGRFMDVPIPRVTVFATSTDMKQWTLCDHVFHNESHDKQTHCGITPIKRIDDRLLIGLGGRFDDACEIIDQHFEITLLYSYDGLHWQPVAPGMHHRSWIRRGRPGDWDFGGVEQGDGLVEVGDQAYVYYGGSGVGNIPTPRHWLPGTGAIGRVRFPRDRFACLTPVISWKGVFVDQVDVCGIVRLPLDAPRSIALNIEIPRLHADSQSHVVAKLLSPDGQLLATATLCQGGVNVPVDFGLPLPASCVLELELVCKGKPDDAPRLYAIYA